MNSSRRLSTLLAALCLFVPKLSFTETTTSPAQSATSPAVPEPLDRPYVKMFVMMGGNPLADKSEENLKFIAKTFGWINSHGGYWLKDHAPNGGWQYPWGKSGGLTADGKTVGEKLKEYNPEIILTNYRNGAYTNQGAMKEAMEMESRMPLSVAVHITSTTLAADLDDQQTEIVFVPAPEVPEGKPEFYPWKASTTEKEYSIDKQEYVAWLRIDDEVMRINKVGMNDDGKIEMTVVRGAFNTKPASHTKDAMVFQPIYCGSVNKEGKEYYLSGIPGGKGGVKSLRYVMQNQSKDFWEFIAEKSREGFAEGCTGMWFDCTCSQMINQGNAYGVQVKPWDLDLKRELDDDTFREYHQKKIDYLYKTIPGGKFYVNWILPKRYFDNGTERLMFSGENGYHPIEGGALECYGSEGMMPWLPTMKMQIDMIKNKYVACIWEKGTGKEGRPFHVFAYTTHLLVQEPDAPQYWGGAPWLWKDGEKQDRNPLQPPSFVYWDLGEAVEHYDDIAQAQLKDMPNVYQRHYSKGLVLVNLKDTHTVKLDEEMYDPEAKAWVKEVTLEPRRGALLLKMMNDE